MQINGDESPMHNPQRSWESYHSILLQNGSADYCGLKRRLDGFRDGSIALPTLVLENDPLNGYGTGVGVKLGERLGRVNGA